MSEAEPTDAAAPSTWEPGRKQYMTVQQEKILAHLQENGWSKLYELSRALGLHSYVVLGSLQCLEAKELVDVCIVKRVKHWALAGRKLPGGGMLMERGAPSLYHTDLKGRITALLNGEPWLARKMIQERLKVIGTPKSIEGAIHNMVLGGQLQRHLVDSPVRQLYAYALPDAPPPTREQLIKIRDEVGTGTAFWPDYEKVLLALKRQPWQSAMQVADSAGVKRGRINSQLKSMRSKGMVKRVRVALEQVGRNRPPDYLYALPDEKEPRRLPIIDGEAAPASAKVRVLRILRDLGPSTIGAIVTEAGKRQGHKIDRGYADKILNDCEELGLVRRDRAGRDGIRWRLIKDLDPIVLHEAEAHVSALRASVSRLRALGYTVTVEISPPAVSS